MAQGDILKRYLDAGVAFTQMTRDRAEAIVKELVENGEIRRQEAQKRIEELVERSQKNTEELLGIIRREVAEQLRNLGLEDLARRAGKGGTADADRANPTSVGANVSETPNAADDAYPAPATTEIKQAAKKAAAGIKKSAGTRKAAAGAKKSAAKKSAAKKAGGAKKA